MLLPTGLRWNCDWLALFQQCSAFSLRTSHSLFAGITCSKSSKGRKENLTPSYRRRLVLPLRDKLPGDPVIPAPLFDHCITPRIRLGAASRCRLDGHCFRGFCPHVHSVFRPRRSPSHRGSRA
ncbi:hypothetical protein C8R46DRAFT_582242 [Mycena filopes]|nr:hypothetical protein C8R46DRAFT_582242 [Mycena filopes]